MKPRLLITLAFSAGLLLPTTSALANEDNKWSFDASLNLFLAGLTGDVTAKGIPTHVSANFGDIFDHLDAGAAGRATIGYDRLVLSTEFSYMKLKAEPPGASLNLEQLFVEPSLGYNFFDFLQAFAGARYNNISGDVTITGPSANTRTATGTQEWWDPIIGAQLSFPLLGQKLTLEGRFDIGGFGAGSDFTWQAFPYVSWRFAKCASAQAGYRWLGTDYETGSGVNKFKYDIIAQGPQIGLTMHF